MDLNFASFRPICVGKNSTWHAWSVPDGAVSVQVQKHQPVSAEQWELLWWPLQFFFMHVTKRQRRKSKISKDIEEKIHGKLRNSMYDENGKTSKCLERRLHLPSFTSWRGAHSHQPMWKDVSPRTSPCEALKAHLPDRFINRLKKECIKDDDDFLLVQ